MLMDNSCENGGLVSHLVTVTGGSESDRSFRQRMASLDVALERRPQNQDIEISLFKSVFRLITSRR